MPPGTRVPPPSTKIRPRPVTGTTEAGGLIEISGCSVFKKA
ncbi:hypothetical protein [Actinokineospora spheciospongiae]|nr:hypothetical protein [Actinokineospora spheciospongiae]PWW65283.1 hypothetical protein DFQ13_10233 [Actinokineospora spheciospongiae]